MHVAHSPNVRFTDACVRVYQSVLDGVEIWSLTSVLCGFNAQRQQELDARPARLAQQRAVRRAAGAPLPDRRGRPFGFGRARLRRRVPGESGPRLSVCVVLRCVMVVVSELLVSRPRRLAVFLCTIVFAFGFAGFVQFWRL